MEQRPTVIYDLKSHPDYLTLEETFNVMKNSGIVIWTSEFGGKEPTILDENITSLDVKLYSIEEFKERFGDLMDKRPLSPL